MLSANCSPKPPSFGADPAAEYSQNAKQRWGCTRVQTWAEIKHWVLTVQRWTEGWGLKAPPGPAHPALRHSQGAQKLRPAVWRKFTLPQREEGREVAAVPGPSLNSSPVCQGVAVLLIIITVCKSVCKSHRAWGLQAKASAAHAHLLKGQLCAFQTDTLEGSLGRVGGVNEKGAPSSPGPLGPTSQ